MLYLDVYPSEIESTPFTIKVIPTTFTFFIYICTNKALMLERNKNTTKIFLDRVVLRTSG